jgi:hypothetical protein
VSTEQDQAKLIADRVARRLAGGHEPARPAGPQSGNGAPVSRELSAIREGLLDLQSKLDRIESTITQNANGPSEGQSRARVINFVSAGPPTRPVKSAPAASQSASPSTSEFVPATHSPWLRDFNPPNNPSQERFGIEEATVAELVEFFESEKKCSIEPGGKPCDHCSMCSSRGF